MAEKTKKPESQFASAGEVEHIRDIIFGPQMRDYEQRFIVVQRDLERLQQALNSVSDRLAEQGSQQESKLREEVERLNRLLAEQEEGQNKRLQEESEQLQARLDRLDKSLAEQADGQGKKLAQEADRLGRMLSEQERNVKQQLQGLRRDMDKANEDLRQELRQLVRKLTDDKTDRLTLGELFIQVGSQLRQGGAPVSLEDLVRALGDQAE